MGKIAASRFWNIPAQVANLDGCDGAQWLLEGVRDGKYHLVERQSPKLGSVRRLGLYLVGLSGKKLRNLD